MVATPDISESCWREVAPSTDWVSKVNETISFQASCVNGSKSLYAKHQGSPQMNMPNETAVSRGMVEFEYRENQLAVFLTKVHHPVTRGLVECVGANARRFANCRWHHQIVPKVGLGYLAVGHVSCQESKQLFAIELHEKWLNSKRAWSSLENDIIVIDRHTGQIRSSGTEADPRQLSE
jgi:hypothetical protein